MARPTPPSSIACHMRKNQYLNNESFDENCKSKFFCLIASTVVPKIIPVSSRRDHYPYSTRRQYKRNQKKKNSQKTIVATGQFWVNFTDKNCSWLLIEKTQLFIPLSLIHILLIIGKTIFLAYHSLSHMIVKILLLGNLFLHKMI